MENQYRLYLERIDPVRNMHRFYALTIEPTLFGDLAVSRRWGRIGTSGRCIQALCRNEREALALFLDLARDRIRRSYRPPSFCGGGEGETAETGRRPSQANVSRPARRLAVNRMEDEAFPSATLGGVERGIGLFDQPLGR